MSSNGDGGLTISSEPDMFSTGYIPQVNYTIIVSLWDPDQSRWGFELTALLDVDNTQGGNLTVTEAENTQYSMSGGREYIKHTEIGTDAGTTHASSSNPKTWTMAWEAPGLGSGNVTFYAAGNGANGDGTASGDFIYTTSNTAPETLPTVDHIHIHTLPGGEGLNVDGLVLKLS